MHLETYVLISKTFTPQAMPDAKDATDSISRPTKRYVFVRRSVLVNNLSVYILEEEHESIGKHTYMRGIGASTTQSTQLLSQLKATAKWGLVIASHETRYPQNVIRLTRARAQKQQRLFKTHDSKQRALRCWLGVSYTQIHSQEVPSQVNQAGLWSVESCILQVNSATHEIL